MGLLSGRYRVLIDLIDLIFCFPWTTVTLVMFPHPHEAEIQFQLVLGLANMGSFNPSFPPPEVCPELASLCVWPSWCVGDLMELWLLVFGEAPCCSRGCEP